MRVRLCPAVGAALVVALAVSGQASAVGPWPGLAQSVVGAGGHVRYSASHANGSTTVRAMRVESDEVLGSATFEGIYGIPAVTSNGLPGGLSPNGRLLVLVEPPHYQGLRTRSTFLVLSTTPLKLMKTVTLKGEFGFDALSPDGRTLYLIQHTASNDLVSYRVRAYDLRAKRLLARVIVDQREPDATMRGYPVARATSRGGSWVYTLYYRPDAQPFIHALNAAQATAVCIDLTWRAGSESIWGARLELAHSGRDLVVRDATGLTVARVDTATLAVH